MEVIVDVEIVRGSVPSVTANSSQMSGSYCNWQALFHMGYSARLGS